MKLDTMVEHENFSKSGWLGVMLERKLRQAGKSKADLARYIGKTKNMVHFYCSKRGSDIQLPSIQVFRKICVFLQCDPKELLGLEWLSKNDSEQAGVIYKWWLVRINAVDVRLEWECPDCKKKNLSYEIKSINGFENNTICCEGCYAVFTKLCQKK